MAVEGFLSLLSFFPCLYNYLIPVCPVSPCFTVVRGNPGFVSALCCDEYPRSGLFEFTLPKPCLHNNSRARLTNTLQIPAELWDKWEENFDCLAGVLLDCLIKYKTSFMQSCYLTNVRRVSLTFILCINPRCLRSLCLMFISKLLNVCVHCFPWFIVFYVSFRYIFVLLSSRFFFVIDVCA